MEDDVTESNLTFGRSVANLVIHSFQASRFSGGKYWSSFFNTVDVRPESVDESPDVMPERVLVDPDAVEVAELAAEAMMNYITFP